jgi:hypothetical protein
MRCLGAALQRRNVHFIGTHRASLRQGCGGENVLPAAEYWQQAAEAYACRGVSASCSQPAHTLMTKGRYTPLCFWLLEPPVNG